MLKQAVRIGTSRQVVIPKRIHDGLKLSAGDYLTVETRGHQVVFTPQSLIDKGIAEGLEDIRQGRFHGPFDSAEELIRSLHQNSKKILAARARHRTSK